MCWERQHLDMDICIRGVHGHPARALYWYSQSWAHVLASRHSCWSFAPCVTTPFFGSQNRAKAFKPCIEPLFTDKKLEILTVNIYSTLSANIHVKGAKTNGKRRKVMKSWANMGSSPSLFPFSPLSKCEI